jgi:hypothetical protein
MNAIEMASLMSQINSKTPTLIGEAGLINNSVDQTIIKEIPKT